MRRLFEIVDVDLQLGDKEVGEAGAGKTSTKPGPRTKSTRPSVRRRSMDRMQLTTRRRASDL